MHEKIFNTQKLPQTHKDQRDSARAERDMALEERNSARSERDYSRDQNDVHEKNKIAQELFIATLSHDLRNPIGAIKMATELLKEECSTNFQQEIVALIERNADQAGELITQLLDAHLVQSGAPLPLKIKYNNLKDVLQKCYDSLAPQHQALITMNIQDTDIFGYWDAVALERAFKNLINNAVKFTDADKNIQIKIIQGPDTVQISFQNFGAIISAENQLRIFDSQHRVSHMETHATAGWGLGLTLVRGIVEAHAGNVSVTSDNVNGTMFTIDLPNDSRISSVELQRKVILAQAESIAALLT